MPAPLRLLAARVSAGAALYTVAVVALLVFRFPLGSPAFFAVAGLATAAWLLVATADGAAAEGTPAGRRLLLIAIGVAVLLRLPLAVAPVDATSDMVRYLWDGRVQTYGLNPYAVVPSDPALAWTHTAESAGMPSRNARTPYAPAAQIFFRLVVSIADSTRAMKLAVLGCDLLTLLLLWRWLARTRRPAWHSLVYAWHPLVIFEVAHSGHIDALGALWTMAALYWLTARRPALATVALVIAVATKPLPMVLAPLFVGRVRLRDAAAGAACLALLAWPFVGHGVLPVGAVPNVVAYIRFNGPVFAAVAAATTPSAAAAAAVLAGLGAATWFRIRRPAEDPAAWAWPMGAALAGAPVIYPWYALYLAPFLTVRATLPLAVWSVSGLGAYLVWHLSRLGGRWVVPGWMQAIEFGLPILAVAALAIRRRRAARPRRRGGGRLHDRERS